MHKQLV